VWTGVERVGAPSALWSELVEQVAGEGAEIGCFPYAWVYPGG